MLMSHEQIYKRQIWQSGQHTHKLSASTPSDRKQRTDDSMILIISVSFLHFFPPLCKQQLGHLIKTFVGFSSAGSIHATTSDAKHLCNESFCDCFLRKKNPKKTRNITRCPLSPFRTTASQESEVKCKIITENLTFSVMIVFITLLFPVRVTF